VEQDRPYAAEDLYRDAAASWHPRASRALVQLLANDGRASERDLQRAQEAAYAEGSRLLEQKREAAAEEWLRYAADHGHASAMFELSVLLHRRGDTDEARKLQEEAAQRGHWLASWSTDSGKGTEAT
jgi:TPR repeat protein